MPELMTTEEVAEYLRCSPSTVRTWIKTEQYPSDCYFRVGGKNGPYRWRKSRLDYYLNNSVQKSEPEPWPDPDPEPEPEVSQQLDLFEEEPVVGPYTEYFEEQAATPSVDEDY